MTISCESKDILLDRIAKKEDTLLISIIQLGVASVLGIVFMLCFEKPALPQTPAQWGAILGLGIICSAYGFVVQPIAQRYTSPEKIGLIFSLEPVFSALLSFLFLHEVLSLKGYMGAALILSGIVLSKSINTKAVPASKHHQTNYSRIVAIVASVRDSAKK